MKTIRYVGLALVCLIVTALISEVAKAQGCINGMCGQSDFMVMQGDTGAASFAAQLSGDRRIHHDRSFNGPEVVFKSSTLATPDAAMAAWQNSPGHARLINSGAITDIQCVGNACVGRGPGGGATGFASRGTCGVTRGSGPIRRLVARLFR